MYVEVWLLWVISFMIAIVPLSIIPIAMKVDKVRPKKRRAKGVEFTPMVAGEGFIAGDFNDMELLVIAKILADAQMRIYWGKDIDYIY